MKKFAGLSIDFLIAGLVTFLLASLAHSQLVLIKLATLGIDIPLSDWLGSSFRDIAGLLPGYGPVVLIAMLLAWSITALLRKYFTGMPDWSFAVTGAIGMLVMHLAMYPLLNVTLIAGARGVFGLLLQSLAGALGGWIFITLRRRRKSS